MINLRNKMGRLPGELTKQEKKIRSYIIRGMSNDEIGKILFIDIRTVKGHVTNIFKKERVKNRVQLILNQHSELAANDPRLAKRIVEKMKEFK